LSKAKLKALCTEHKYDAGVVIADSTLSKLGTTRYTCTKCGDSYTKDDIPKKIAVRTVTLDKTNYVYTGSAIKPIITVKAGNTVLKAGTDYTVSYSNNVKTGKAKLTVKGIGKYAGTKTATFNIIPKKVSGFRQTSYAVNNVPLKWNATAGADGYAVVRKDATTGKLEFVGITKETTYKVTGLKSGSKYQYGVRAYKVIDGNKVFGEVSVIRTTITRTLAPKLKVSPWTKRATVFVDKVRGADGYEIYMCTKKYGKYTKIATLTGSSMRYRKTGLLSDKKYYFKVRSYKINAGGAKVYSAYSSIVAGTTR
ncbi:MAG: fibronectin type III domain-containing protein, partial [Lachnospiraceae bacterium]|nr:fibronectin type III domain-containing protein [Lachnospiraceae bacterium]